MATCQVGVPMRPAPGGPWTSSPEGALLAGRRPRVEHPVWLCWEGLSGPPAWSPDLSPCAMSLVQETSKPCVLQRPPQTWGGGPGARPPSPPVTLSSASCPPLQHRDGQATAYRKACPTAPALPPVSFHAVVPLPPLGPPSLGPALRLLPEAGLRGLGLPGALRGRGAFAHVLNLSERPALPAGV